MIDRPRGSSTAIRMNGLAAPKNRAPDFSGALAPLKGTSARNGAVSLAAARLRAAVVVGARADIARTGGIAAVARATHSRCSFAMHAAVVHGTVVHAIAGGAGARTGSVCCRRVA